MHRNPSKPSKIHSKSKPTLQFSPKLSIKPSSRIPDILTHSYDSQQLICKPTHNRLQTPPHTPSQNSVKNHFKHTKVISFKDQKQQKQKQLLGKSTVKLKINLFETSKVNDSIIINPPIHTSNRVLTPRKPITPQPKVISFNLDITNSNNSKNPDNNTINNNNNSYQKPINDPNSINLNILLNPSSSINNPISNILKLSSNQITSTPTQNKTSIILNNQAPLVSQNPVSSQSFKISQNQEISPNYQTLQNTVQNSNISQNSQNPVQATPSNDRKSLISTISKTFSFKSKPPITTPSFYRTKQALGKGSFGKVLLCSQLLTDKNVAIKVIEKAQLKNSIAEKRVIQEIQLLRRLDHPNIVKLLEVFETETTIYIVMEHMDKGDLYTLLKSQKKGRLSEPQAKPLFLQILRGLEYIHSQRILHRDIKLDNILIDQSSNLKICDFGISRTIIPSHRMTEQSGTPAFMAPEIISGGGYEGFGSDIWSLGVVLYCLLTGTLPFRGNSATELNNNIIKGIFNKEIKVTDEAKNLLERLLDVSPESRITLKELWGHPWVTGEVLQEETVSLFQKNLLNEEIIKKIEGFGYPRDFVIKSMENKTVGHVNVCYYTLAH